MKYLLILLLMSGYVSADYSIGALRICQIWTELAAASNNYSIKAHKIKGATYSSGGSYAEFIVDIEGQLAKVKCSVIDGKVKYLMLGDHLIVNEE